MRAHRPRGRVQVLAGRNSIGVLLGATSCRCAAELTRRHGAGKVPTAEIENLVTTFSSWLQLACDAPREPPARGEAGE